MSRWILCVLVLGSAVAAQDPKPTPPHTNGAAGSEAGAPAAKGTPAIECPEPEWRFGSTPQMSTLKHEFLVRNVGDGPLTIKQVVPTCQCTASMPKKSVLAPGEETGIETTFNSQTFQGSLTKNITIVSDDPKRPSLVLTLTGEVLPPYFVRPKDISLGKIEKGTPSKETEVVFTISRGAEVQVKSIKCSSEYLEIVRETEIEKHPDGSRTKAFVVRLAPGTPVGLVKESITFMTDAPAMPKAEVSVSANVQGEVQLDPRTFNLGRVKKGETTSKELVLTKSGTADLEILGVDVVPPGPFKTEVLTDEAGRKYRIRVSIEPTASEGYHRRQITVKTNCKGESALQAFFYAFVDK